MGIDWADYDRDGRLDLYVTTYENEIKNLYRNLGRDSFIDIAARVGLDRSPQPWVGWGTRFLDYDRDGRLDLFLVNGHVMDNVHVLRKGNQYLQPLLLFRQEASGLFSDVSGAAGPAFQRPISGRAAAFGDLDNDGRPDVLVSNVDGPHLLLRNAAEPRGDWLGLHLVGKQSNRMALGATVRVDAGGISLLRVCTTSGSVLAAHDPRILVGLGEGERAARISIRWPGGSNTLFSNVAAGRYYRIEEGAAGPIPLQPPSGNRPGPGPS